MQSKGKAADKKQQTEIYKMTQIHDSSNPIFNEKFIFPLPEKLDALYAQLWDDADYVRKINISLENINRNFAKTFVYSH